jgi:hypothetical protein
MAKPKYRREKVGSICKGKDGKSDYFKVFKDHTLLDGSYLNLESKKDQLKNLEEGIAAGRLKDPETIASMRERIDKIPDYVRFEVYKVNKES